MRKLCTLASALTAFSCLGLAPGCHGHGTPHHSVSHSRMARVFHGGGHGQHSGEHLDQVADALDLTAEQRKAVARVLTTHMAQLRVEVDAWTRALGDQVTQVHDGSFDEAEIRAAARTVADAQANLAVRIGSMLRDVHAELTPDQLERARKLHTPEFGARASEHIDELSRAVSAWAQRQ